MKILIVGGIQKDEPELSDIGSTPTLYSYFLRRELERLGCEVVYCNCEAADLPPEQSVAHYRNLEIPDADHALCVEQRAFYNRHGSFWAAFREKITGYLGTICDNSNCLGQEDVTFHATGESQGNAVKIGFAADGELLKPDKGPNTRILIDHSYYSGASKASVEDRSTEILSQIGMAMLHTETSTEFRRFVSGGVESIDPVMETEADQYNRIGLPWNEAAEEYRKADVFIVTHRESLGISVIESAMAGALILSPAGFINPEVIGGLHHIQFEGAIPWERVVRELNWQKSRAMAEKYDRWGEMAGIIKETFEQ